MMIEDAMILLIVFLGFVVPLLVMTVLVEVLMEIRDRMAWRKARALTLQDLARRGK